MRPDRIASTVLLPVGQFFGTFHPVVGSAERYHRVRLAAEVWELDDVRFTLWSVAHGDRDHSAWSAARVREMAATRCPGTDVGPLLDDLLAEGLAAVVVPGTAGAVEFASRHQMGARMLGLGNTSERPWSYRIGLPGRPVLAVSRTVYDLWERCPSGESLWAMCRALAGEEHRGGGTDPDLVDPERLLAAFLGTLHPLLATGVVYLEPWP